MTKADSQKVLSHRVPSISEKHIGCSGLYVKQNVMPHCNNTQKDLEATPIQMYVPANVT